MLEAAQPTPPTVTEFLTVLRGVLDLQEATGASSELFGGPYRVSHPVSGEIEVHMDRLKPYMPTVEGNS